MRTRVGTVCDRLIEAGWLIALIVVPLFFNIYSSRVFEPDKIGILRTIATLMLVAWIIKTADEYLARTPDAQIASPAHRLRNALRTPLVTFTLLLAAVYMLATVLSVVPRVSLWGSYQRLQGTYTTLSYMVIYALMLQGLRRYDQLQRVITTMIVTSVPIALYGLVQHYGIDPLPWGGDVTTRVASSMGNPIFVGAYLIMVIPLTLARFAHMQFTALPPESVARTGRTALALLAWGALPVQMWAWATLGIERGLAISLLVTMVMVFVALVLRRPMPKFLLLGCYGLILSAQLVCLVYTQSRGPLLGLLAGLFFFGLLYLYARRKRLATLALVGAALAATLTLFVLNLPDSPLAAARQIPYAGRLGNVFETESGTGKVRVLIWEGAVDMLRANPLRTVVGYGPESMYVAYNPYYPPELAHYEARNASPDRAHNETFDALITTGVIGLSVYMALFASIFGFGLHALGLMRSRRQRRLFYACGAAGALLGLIVPLILDGGLRLAGVGVPMGFLVGFTVYVTVLAMAGMRSGDNPPLARPEGWRLLLLVALVAAVVAHFVEIHFGIAIAATRTYFWVSLALLVRVGQGRIPATALDATESAEGSVTRPAVASSRSRRRDRRRRNTATPGSDIAAQSSEPPGVQIVVMAVLAGLTLSTLAWNYVLNPLGLNEPLRIITLSFTTLAAGGRPETGSLGLLWLTLTTLVVGLLVTLAQVVENESDDRSVGWWLASMGHYLAVAISLALTFALLHATRLRPGADPPAVIYVYYALLFVVAIGLAALLYRAASQPANGKRHVTRLAYPVLVILALLLVNRLNVRMVRADIIYKQGLRYDQQRLWDGAILHYEKAVLTSPDEDYYYLFYGRALMEKAKAESDSAAADALYGRALNTLRVARAQSPLNTDHTANLARLYRTWASSTTDAALRQKRLNQALALYEAAAESSPNNAQVLNEWGLAHADAGDAESAMALYRRSLALDARFSQTYMLMGDLHMSRSEWQAAIDAYEQAMAYDRDLAPLWSRIGYAHSQLGAWDEAIQANLRVLAMAPDDYNTLKNLGVLYSETHRLEDALLYVQQALKVAPPQEEALLEGFILQLEAGLGKD
jgi:tetratricopeptide (TPR) repeat protein/O-antigen ligase